MMLMEKEFEVNYNSKIILYGAASIGKLMYEHLSRHNYTVIGFVDKRADEINEFKGLPVWAVGKVPSEIKEDKEVVIFVAVKNVFEHDKIAAVLVRNGFYRIIFKPYAFLTNNANSDELIINRVYENFAVGGECKKTKKIPLSMNRMNDYSKDYGLIKQIEDEVIAYIPIDYIYTNNYTDEHMKKWGNLNLLAFFTHIQFFKYLQGVPNMDYKYYIEEYCVYTAKLQKDIEITQAWKENVFDNRMQIFKEMNLSLQVDTQFFVENAPTAEWNEKGWFNLTSGKHRATFLASKGKYLIPLRISNKDYLKFLNMEAFYKLKENCKKVDRDISNFNIPHPYTYRHSENSVVFNYILIEKLCMYLAVNLYKKYGEVDFSKIYLVEYIDKDFLQVLLYLIRLGCVGDFRRLFDEPYISILELQHLKNDERKKESDKHDKCDFIDLDLAINGDVLLDKLNGDTAVFVAGGTLESYIENLENRYKVIESINIKSNSLDKKVYICDRIEGDV